MKRFSYNVDGYDEPWTIDEDKEDKFLKWAKDNNKEIKKSQDLGNQQSSTADATAEQDIQASTEEVTQPQEKQKKKDTDLSLDIGSLESERNNIFSQEKELTTL